MALRVKNLPANAGDTRDVDLTPGQGRTLEEGMAKALQYSCLQNPHGQRSPAGCIIHGVAKSQKV